MNHPHVIRLRGPWQRTILDASDELSAPVRVKMPCSVLDDVGSDFHGSLEYQRFFNSPSGIDNATRIGIRFQAIEGAAKISLNGTLLGKVSRLEPTVHLDVTGKLARRNDLRVQFEVAPKETTAGLVGDVCLEIG